MAKVKLSVEERDVKQQNEKDHIRKYWDSIQNVKMKHEVVCGDSRNLSTISDQTVDLAITSPPYYNAKEYSQWDSIDAYLADMKAVFSEVFRTLKSGRRFCLNISDIPFKGESGVRWYPLGAYLTQVCEEIGFELADRIFWFKTPIKGFQYGSLPYPPSPLICDSMEYVFVFRKPGKCNYSYCKPEFKEASKLVRSEYAEFTKQIWSIPRVRLSQNVDGHIAPFPYELPYRCIKMYSFVGDVILDPFGGSGTTSIAAMNTKRNSVIYEVNKNYSEMINENLTRNNFLYGDDLSYIAE